MNNFKKFKRSELLGMHLSILREIGRCIGVKAPAAMKKEELAEDIINIQQGKLEPVTQNNKGAPPKMRIDLSQYMVDEYEFKPVEPVVLSDSVKKEDGVFVAEAFSNSTFRATVF